MPTVAVVIPLYNGGKFIEKALRSALVQDHLVDEIIVVDDGSSDNGTLIVERLLQQYKTIRLITKLNGGQASARNFGVAASSCDLIAFLDQDDIWYPSHIRDLIQPFLEQKENIGWSYSNLDEIDVGGEMVRHGLLDFHPNEHPKRSLHSCLDRDMHIFPTATLVSKLAFDTVGGFDEQFVGYEDDDLFVRFFRAGFRNIYIAKSTCQWRMHSTSTTFGRVMADSRDRYFQKLIRTFPDDPALLRFFVRDLIAPRFTASAVNDLRSAVHREDTAGVALAIGQVREFSAYLSDRHRFRIRAAMWLLSRATFRRLYRAAPGFALRRINAALGM
jgi:glycosyltransferase involved in cell wall biosynthesis